jgi:Flp pilus assembly protein TadD
MSPKDEQLLGNLADSYRWSGQKDKAVETYDRAIRLGYGQLQVNPRDSGVMGDLALYYAKKGDGQQAEQYIRQARTIDPSNLQLLSDEIEIYSLNDKPAEALKALREAFQKGYSPEEAQNDPELAKIKNLPEFQKLVSAYSKKTN